MTTRALKRKQLIHLQLMLSYLIPYGRKFQKLSYIRHRFNGYIQYGRKTMAITNGLH